MSDVTALSLNPFNPKAIFDWLLNLFSRLCLKCFMMHKNDMID